MVRVVGLMAPERYQRQAPNAPGDTSRGADSPAFLSHARDVTSVGAGSAGEARLRPHARY
jgi:hypothetical protein